MASTASLMTRIQRAVLSPEHGITTTHFWGPVANWGLVGAAVYDASVKGPETIDMEMTATMIAYSGTFMGFAWYVQPRNYLLFACHVFNITAQTNQMKRAIEYQMKTSNNAEKNVKEMLKKVGIGSMILSGFMASNKRLFAFFGNSNLPPSIKNLMTHAAGPLTFNFWAPVSKWLFSINNLKDLNKPVEKISIAQFSALTLTGIIWTRYSFVINPINYNLALVNATLGLSSGWHLSRKLKSEYVDKHTKEELKKRD